MSLQNHLAQLEQSHASLETEIHEALKHPSIDELALTELKRRKLQLKDQIERLRQSSQLH